MTNAVTPAAIETVGGMQFTCYTPPWVLFVSLIGWGTILLGGAFVVFTGARMLLTMRHKGPDRIVEIARVGVMSKIGGWPALLAGISMTWASLQMFWDTLTMMSDAPVGLIAVGYRSSLLPGFCGAVVWALAMFQASIAEYLGIRQQKGTAQPPDAG